MSYTKLKDFATCMVNEDGSYVRTTPSPKQTVYIEKVGDMRMFIFVPEFMASALFGSWKPKQAGVELSVMGLTKRNRYTKDKETGRILAGRSPESLEQAWRDMCTAFSQLVTTTTLEPRIVIRNTRDNFRDHSATNNETRISFDFYRYLHNTREPKDRYDTVDHYEWNEDNKPVRRRSMFIRDEDVEVVYDPVLWERLCLLRDQMRAASKQLDSLIKNKSIVERLLSGKSPLMLEAK
jgi:hypothetical protein